MDSKIHRIPIEEKIVLTNLEIAPPDELEYIGEIDGCVLHFLYGHRNTEVFTTSAYQHTYTFERSWVERVRIGYGGVDKIKLVVCKDLEKTFYYGDLKVGNITIPASRIKLILKNDEPYMEFRVALRYVNLDSIEGKEET